MTFKDKSVRNPAEFLVVQQEAEPVQICPTVELTVNQPESFLSQPSSLMDVNVAEPDINGISQPCKTVEVECQTDHINSQEAGTQTFASVYYSYSTRPMSSEGCHEKYYSSDDEIDSSGSDLDSNLEEGVVFSKLMDSLDCNRDC
jgi:hypothetical protein